MLNAHTCTPIIYPSASHSRMPSMDHTSNTQSWKDHALPPFQGAQHGSHQQHTKLERPCPAPIPGCPAWITSVTHKAGKTMPCPHSRVPSMDHISNTQSWKDHALPPFQGAQHGSHQQHTCSFDPVRQSIAPCCVFVAPEIEPIVLSLIIASSSILAA